MLLVFVVVHSLVARMQVFCDCDHSPCAASSNCDFFKKYLKRERMTGAIPLRVACFDMQKLLGEERHLTRNLTDGSTRT